MNQELLIRLAHYLYNEVNMMYGFGAFAFNNALLLKVGQAFNRLYHQTENQADIDLLKSVECGDLSVAAHGVACRHCMVDELSFRGRVNSLMTTLLLKVLAEKGYSLEKIQTYVEMRNHISPADLIVLNNRILKKVKKFYPLKSLEALSAKVIADNKKRIGPVQISVVIPSSLFVKYPEMEVDADRLVKTQLSQFLFQYRPASLEARVLSCLAYLSQKPEGLYDAVHRLLTETNYKDYNAYLRKYLSQPIISAMKSHRHQPEKFANELRAILKKYEPQAIETIFLKYLRAFEKKDVCTEELKKLLSSRTLKDKMTEHLLNTLHAPLVSIITAHENLSPKISK